MEKIFVNKCEDLVSIIKDFRKNELKIQINTNHVQKWVSQFSEKVREIILDETIFVFKKWYFNKEYIMRLFKKEIHCTITDYINRLRIFYSLKDLREHNLSILSVGLNHGFVSLEYYSEIFRKNMGVSPSIYRDFTMRSINVLEEEIITIQNSLSKLNSFYESITYYKNNRKKSLSKSLSIFK